MSTKDGRINSAVVGHILASLYIWALAVGVTVILQT